MNPPTFTLVSPRLDSRSRAAFSLVEMLAVLAVISLLATMITPAISSIFSGKNSGRALDVVSNSAAVARQTAMTTGRPAALVVNRSAHSGPTDMQAVLILSAPDSVTGAAASTTTWTAKGNWTKVPSNVQISVFPRDGQGSFYEAGSSGPMNAALPVKLDGKAVTSYDYIVFYPDGSVAAPASGPALTFGRYKGEAAGAGSVPVDYTLVVQSNSGRAKILQ